MLTIKAHQLECGSSPKTDEIYQSLKQQAEALDARFFSLNDDLRAEGDRLNRKEKEGYV